MARSGLRSKSERAATPGDDTLAKGEPTITIEATVPGDAVAATIDGQAAEIDAHWPILILSEPAEPHQRVKLLRFGADDILIKPFDGEELLADAAAQVPKVRMTLSWRELDSNFGFRATPSALTQSPRRLLACSTIR